MIFKDFNITIAKDHHINYVKDIIKEIEESARERGIGISKKSQESLTNRIKSGDAIIAINNNNLEWGGFCYIDRWDKDKFVVHSGLIINPNFRNYGLAKIIKITIFEHTRKKYPDYKIFGITSSLAVMKINYNLGYTPVTYNEITQDENFWNGCKSCVNYNILKSKNYKNCLCTSLLYDYNKIKKISNIK